MNSILVLVLLATPVTPVIIDTDVGTDIDDAFALALAARSPALNLLGVTTVSGDARARARIAGRLLAVAGYPEVPVYAGESGKPQPMAQLLWADEFDNAHGAIHDSGAVDFMRYQVDRHPGQVVLLCLGQLSNVASLLTKYPDTGQRIASIVLMGGSISGRTEWNFSSDPDAARQILSSGIPILMVPFESTETLRLDYPFQKELQNRDSLTDSLALLRTLWGGKTPVMYDPAAVAATIDLGLCSIRLRHIAIDDTGATRVLDDDLPNVAVCEHVDRVKFFNLLMSRLFSEHV